MLEQARKRPSDHGPTAELIDHVRTMAYEELPAATIDRSVDLVLDHVGVALYGATFEWSRIAQHLVESERCAPEATIYGGGCTSIRNAAMANGVAGHAIELDDTHDESLTHPGCVIIPAALAVAEFMNASGGDCLTAIIAGYDAQCRIGAVVGRSLVATGLHPTAQLGTFGATVASARLLGLTERQFHNALGLAASMTSGIMKFTEDPDSTMVKRLHAGLPAERGILAARLALEGFDGPSGVIEGRYGYANTFARIDDLSRMTLGLGKQYEVERCSIKLYPCCRMFHSLIEAISDCRQNENFDADQIQEIATFGPSNMVDGHMIYRPKSVLAAQYSLPFTVAVATIADPSQPESFNSAAMERSDLLSLSDKVRSTIDPELQALYPEKFPSRVEFRMQNGSVIVRQVLDSLSTPARPIKRDHVVEKFKSVTASVLKSDRQEQILGTICSLPDLPSIRTLTDLLGDDGRH